MPSKFELDLLGWTTDLRVWLLDHVSDEDLAFALPGNRPLGDLIVELGDTERAYAASFRTRRLEWGTPTDDPELARSTARLRAWFETLDAELRAALTAVPDDEFRDGTVDRGDGFQMPMGSQFHTYREAILIACAKIDVYLRALGTERGHQWADWLG